MNSLAPRDVHISEHANGEFGKKDFLQLLTKTGISDLGPVRMLLYGFLCGDHIHRSCARNKQEKSDAI